MSITVRLPTLTDRERDVLLLRASGVRNPEISQRLNITYSTVLQLLHAARRRLGIKHRRRQ